MEHNDVFHAHQDGSPRSAQYDPATMSNVLRWSVLAVTHCLIAGCGGGDAGSASSPAASASSSSSATSSTAASSSSSQASSSSGSSVTIGGTPYAGYSYTLPATRPFISLKQYATAGLASSAFTRLKGQVDDVVAVTNALPAGSTYANLVSALNSNHYSYSPVDSVVMFSLTGNTAYIDQAIRMVDLFVTAENARIAAGQTPEVASDSYLNVGLYLSELSLAYDHGYGRLTATQRAAWSTYAEQTLYNLWNYNSATWGRLSAPWSGWSTSDPGDNYFYGFLRATQLWALASQNPAWFSFLQSRKYTLLVPFFSNLAGGGSREGTGYGTALGDLFENYAYWKDSTGEDLSAYSSHAADTIDYWLHATVPTFQYFAPIGDQSRNSMPIMFDYQRKLVLQSVALNRGTPQALRGNWWLNRAQLTDGGSGWQVGSMRYNYNFRFDLLASSATEQAPTSLLYDASGAGALFARSDWSTSASWMHVNAGHYDQSHAHQDQGSFSFFKGGWLTLTSNTRSNSGINQDTGVENVLRFQTTSRVIPQNYATPTKTVSDSGGTLQVNANLTPAYSSNAASVTNWTRQFTYVRATHSLTLHDLCAVAPTVTPVWQLHLPVAPVLQQDGSWLAGRLRISVALPVTATASVVSMASVSSDFTGGYRFELRDPARGCEFQVSLVAQ